jgi:membrane protein YqaA with SNARE-associated domain
VTTVFRSAFGFFLTWWGAFLMGALDSTMVVFVPFGIDAIVIYLAARDRDLFWIYPLLASAGSLAGAALTVWIGKKMGDVGLERVVSKRRLDRLRQRVRDSGAIALALPALLPPPFPLTPFVLTCGALEVNLWRFFTAFTLARMMRFGVEATLARAYGSGILGVLESDVFQAIVLGFVAIALAGTVVSGVLLWRSTRVAPAGVT